MAAGIEQLTPTNHTLYRRVQHLVRLNWSWEAIAEDVGIRQVNDLCEWVLDYREPKTLPLVAHSLERAAPARRNEVAERTAQFIAWRKQNGGARKALEALRS